MLQAARDRTFASRVPVLREPDGRQRRVDDSDHHEPEVVRGPSARARGQVRVTDVPDLLAFSLLPEPGVEALPDRESAAAA